MSAWIVEKAHIDALVTRLIELDLASEASADDVGQMLWDENRESYALMCAITAAWEAEHGEDERPNGPWGINDMSEVKLGVVAR